MVAHCVPLLEWGWLSHPSFAACPDISVYSDALGSWGFGAWCQPSHKWFQGSWPATWSSVNISAKELLLVVLEAATWGSLWSGQAVRFHCDNAVIVHTISSGKSTEPLVMQLLKGLYLFAMEHAFCFTAAHIAGVENGAANALSRNQAHLFLTRDPQAAPAPDTLPESLLSLFLVETTLDWLLESWRQQLTSILA